MIKLSVDLYKPSGKWAYGFSVWIKEPHGYIETEDLLKEISLLQNQVHPACVVDGQYVVVIKESEETVENPEYKGFLCRMVPCSS